MFCWDRSAHRLRRHGACRSEGVYISHTDGTAIPHDIIAVMSAPIMLKNIKIIGHDFGKPDATRAISEDSSY